jgi:hypothetical protein
MIDVLSNFRVVTNTSSDVPRFVVLGPPGSGKTRYLALRASQGQLRLVNRSMLPVVVRLPEWQQWAEPGKERPRYRLAAYLEALYQDHGASPAPTARQWDLWLAGGEVLLLLDGLDELSLTTFVNRAVEPVLRDLILCPTILTCRSISFEQHEALLPSLPVFMLGPLEEKLGDYIRAYGKHSARSPKFDANALIAQLDGTPQMMPLASNPLLLDLICYAVDDERERITLPATRGELYDRAVKKLLGQRKRVAVMYPDGRAGPDAQQQQQGSSRIDAPWKLARSVFEQHERLLKKVDSVVLQVQQRVLDVCGWVVPLAQSEALFREPYVARDVINHRAAAIALTYSESILHRNDRAGPSGAGTEESLVQAMQNWRGLFSPTGKPYRSLDRTLMNLPAGISPSLLCNLNRVHLERPVLDPLELTTLLLHVGEDWAGTEPDVAAARHRIFHHASAREIRAVLGRVGRASRQVLHADRNEDLLFMIKYLAEYPPLYRGDLSALATRAIRWHEGEERRSQLETSVRHLGGLERQTAPPPIPLPAIPGVSFLASVNAVVAEALRMRHCIFDYAGLAVRGRNFLFHVDHEGEAASIAVDRLGRVREAAGPANVRNRAADWGRQQLRLWAAGFRARKPSQGAAPLEIPEGHSQYRTVRFRASAGTMSRSALGLHRESRVSL